MAVTPYLLPAVQLSVQENLCFLFSSAMLSEVMDKDLNKIFSEKINNDL